LRIIPSHLGVDARHLGAAARTSGIIPSRDGIIPSRDGRIPSRDGHILRILRLLSALDSSHKNSDVSFSIPFDRNLFNFERIIVDMGKLPNCQSAAFWSKFPSAKWQRGLCGLDANFR
jgi:hypothetical protein